ncbi:hypothetical protein HanIR_Chr12g0572111 [Helianthus annuus]|nr:hypothetical protein HanIR_Chr12g0572111 [Helianthus annuus]
MGDNGEYNDGDNVRIKAMGFAKLSKWVKSEEILKGRVGNKIYPNDGEYNDGDKSVWPVKPFKVGVALRLITYIKRMLK